MATNVKVKRKGTYDNPKLFNTLRWFGYSIILITVIAIVIYTTKYVGYVNGRNYTIMNMNTIYILSCLNAGGN